MAKGSGLTSIDPDPIGLFLHKPTIINSFPEDHLHHHHHHHQRHQNLLHHHRLKLESPQAMEAIVNKRSSPSTTIHFPVNLNCTHDQESPLPSTEKRTIIDEMDFFAEKKLDETSRPAETSDPDKKDQLSEPTQLDFNLNTGLHLLTANTSSDQSVVDDGVSPNSEDKRTKSEITILQAELERMTAENERLREMLNQVTNNYNTLQMHLLTFMQQQQRREDDRRVDNGEEEQDGKGSEEKSQNGHGGTMMVPRQFMDLGPAGAGETEDPSLSSSEGRSRDRSRSPAINNVEAVSKEFGREDSPDQGSTHGWGPNKVPRLNPSKNVDQAAAEATMRKARVSVRARSEAPMITDGCQWRKYGQKMAKGNPCPRAYYRCTMAAGCPVRKQVQRCAEDRTILITTYEGNHNHPLPPAAMAMASTTSSAARMLLSGSMPSADGLMNSNFLARTLLPCSSSMATISASAPFPTVTLDLTQNPNNPLQFQRPPNQFQVPFPTPSQNFAGAPAALLPQIFGQALYNQSKFSGLQMSQDMDQSGQLGHEPQGMPPLLHQAQQNSLAETVSALTMDPNFTAALAAAITSIIGSSHPNAVTTNNANGTATNSNNNGSVTRSNNNSNGKQ